MGERGAFLTTTTASKPSIFEVLAQESLAATVHPALKRVANFLASYNPQRFGWILNWFEEVYLIFNYTVQKHYIRTYGGSFAETFYDMRRVALGQALLPLRERRLSLLCLVLLEYARHKLETHIEKWKTQQVPPNSLKAQFLSCHRHLQVAWRAACLTSLLGYMTGKTEYHSPLLRLAGVGLQSVPDTQANSRDLSQLSFWRRSVALVGPGLARCLEMGAFTLQFLQWWHSEEGPRPQLSALPTPPPPQLLPGAEEYADICPICLQKQRIETVLPISGFVFCYRCIVTHISRTGVCPVTNYPAKPADLVRLYANTG